MTAKDSDAVVSDPGSSRARRDPLLALLITLQLLSSIVLGFLGGAIIGGSGKQAVIAESPSLPELRNLLETVADGARREAIEHEVILALAKAEGVAEIDREERLIQVGVAMLTVAVSQTAFGVVMLVVAIRRRRDAGVAVRTEV